MIQRDKIRLLSRLERLAVGRLLEIGGKQPSELRSLRVVDMDDGGMGSLRFVVDDQEENRRRDKDVATGTFRDTDGVDVFVVLDVDRDGKLFELDVWKVDRSKLLSWPAPQDIVEAYLPNSSIN